MVEIKRVTTKIELQNILDLQKANIRKLIGENEAGKEGFLIAQYTMEMMEAMHQFQPSIIAKDGDEIAGYVVVTDKNSYGQHPLIDDLFDSIDKLHYNGFSLKEVNYILVGQLCVAKAYRGTGLVQKMYQYYRDCLKTEYSYLVTDIAQENLRSIKAHVKTGFEIIHSIQYGGIGWEIVIWDWNKL